jgi:hypothetical protein
VTNEQHNSYIAYSFLAHAGFQLLMLLMMAAFFSVIFFIPDDPGQPGPPKALFGVMIGMMTVFQMAFTLPSVIAGYALLKHKPWARVASIVGAVIAALSVPFGTAAAVYALWFFFSENWKEVYPSERGSQPRPQIAYGVESQRAAYEAEENVREPFSVYEPPDWR